MVNIGLNPKLRTLHPPVLYRLATSLFFTFPMPSEGALVWKTSSLPPRCAMTMNAAWGRKREREGDEKETSISTSAPPISLPV